MEGGDSAIGKTGDDAEERDPLLGVVANAGWTIRLRSKGDVAKMVWGLGGELLAPHMDADQVTKLFGEQHNIDLFAP